MPLHVSCPSCGAMYQLPDTVAGKKVRCKQCEQVFRVGGGSDTRAKYSPRSGEGISCGKAGRRGSSEDDLPLR